MTFDMLHTLVDYHYWARDRMFPVVEALTDEQLRRPLGNSFSSSVERAIASSSVASGISLIGSGQRFHVRARRRCGR